jgi:hypothetical protein
MAPFAFSLASKLNLWVKIEDSLITFGATCTKHATYKEQAVEFFEEASAHNTDTATFDLRKIIYQVYVQLKGVHQHPVI